MWTLPVASLKHSCNSSRVFHRQQWAQPSSRFRPLACLAVPVSHLQLRAPGMSGKSLGCLQPGKQKGRQAAVTKSLVLGSSMSLILVTAAGIKSSKLASYYFRQHKSVMTEYEAWHLEIWAAVSNPPCVCQCWPFGILRFCQSLANAGNQNSCNASRISAHSRAEYTQGFSISFNLHPIFNNQSLHLVLQFYSCWLLVLCSLPSPVISDSHMPVSFPSSSFLPSICCGKGQQEEARALL